jgi:hypothetical protein
MALFTTALGLYGGVLWSGELQGFITHEMVPSGGRGRSGRRGPWAGAQQRQRAAGAQLRNAQSPGGRTRCPLGLELVPWL